MFLFFEGYGDHRDRPVRTPSFPTRRSSDLNTFKGSTRTKQIFLVPTLKPVVTPASLIEQENGYGTRFGCHRHGHSSHGLRHARGEGGLESRGCRRKAVRRHLRATRLRSQIGRAHV